MHNRPYFYDHHLSPGLRPLFPHRPPSHLICADSHSSSTKYLSWVTLSLCWRVSFPCVCDFGVGGGRWGYIGGGGISASPIFFEAFNLKSYFPPVALIIPFPVTLSLPRPSPTLYSMSSFTSFLLALRSQIDFTSEERSLLIFPSKVGLSPTVPGFGHFP